MAGFILYILPVLSGWAVVWPVSYTHLNDSPVGWKGERTRLFLSDTGYEKALDSQEKGQIKILSHAKVRQGNLHYDHSDQLR